MKQENNQWPWSKFHTWQSWRERYRKHQDYFDYRIRRYKKGKDSLQQQSSKVVKEAKRDNKAATKPALPSQPVRDTMKEEKVAPQPKPNERVVAEDNQKEAEAPQEEDDPMYDLFGSYVEEEEKQYVCYNIFYLSPYIFKQEREHTCAPE